MTSSTAEKFGTEPSLRLLTFFVKSRTIQEFPSERTGLFQTHALFQEEQRLFRLWWNHNSVSSICQDSQPCSDLYLEATEHREWKGVSRSRRAVHRRGQWLQSHQNLYLLSLEACKLQRIRPPCQRI